MTARAPKDYDQDSEDLSRWLLKQQARKLLMKREFRQKREREFYTDFHRYDAPSPDANDCEVFEVPYDRYRLVPVMLETEDGEASAVKLAAKFRVVNCCRDKIGRDVQPEIWYSKRSDRASLHKVQMCGSVWTCPTCSRKINMKRQAQIAKAYELLLDNAPMVQLGSGKSVRQGDALLVTLTIKHGAGDHLKALFKALKGANRVMQQGRPYRSLTAEGNSYVGRVSATEITYGEAGWHPHCHELWFFDRHMTAVDIEAFRATLFKAWHLACLDVGLPAPLEFTPSIEPRAPGHGLGVDVRRALTAAEYMTKTGTLNNDVAKRKWTVEKEMASAHAKKAKKSGRTPFQLLFDSAEGDEHAGMMFQIYAHATLRGHQLDFSKGLSKRLRSLGYTEHLQKDEELAAQLDEGDSKILGKIKDRHFDILCNAERWGEPNAFGKVLFICKTGGFDEAMRWLVGLTKTPPPK